MGSDQKHYSARSKHTKRFWAERDKEDYTCPCCGRGHDEVDQFEVHHIDGDPTNGDESNLKALCRRCHYQENGREPPRSLDQWKADFSEELMQ
jgi:5-methylcytosine-specific restriction endonuclease McrA